MSSIFGDMYLGGAGGGGGSSYDEPAIGTGGSSSSSAGRPVSPYLNFDPASVPKLQPEFIYPDERHKAQTSKRTAVALSQIGACCIIGAGLGATAGLYNGLKATTLAGQVGKIRRTQILNYIMKQGSATSCSLGIIASFYSVVGVGVVYARDQEDSFNTFIAAATTGALYKSTAGLKASGIGAAVGLGLAALYTVATAADEHQNLWGKFKYNRL